MKNQLKTSFWACFLCPFRQSVEYEDGIYSPIQHWTPLYGQIKKTSFVFHRRKRQHGTTWGWSLQGWCLCFQMYYILSNIVPWGRVWGCVTGAACWPSHLWIMSNLEQTCKELRPGREGDVVTMWEDEEGRGVINSIFCRPISFYWRTSHFNPGKWNWWKNE